MGKLFEELKRRKVFRVAAVYAVVAWVLIQVSDVVLPTFGAPAWVNQTLIFLFAIGLFPTLIVAWAYERTPEGVRPDYLVQASRGSPATSSQPINYIILVIVLLVAGFQVTDRFMSVPAIEPVAVATRSNANNSSSPVRRFELNLGVTVPRSGSFLKADVALSPDGRRLAIGLQRPGAPQQIYVQELDQVEAVHLPGADGGDYPAFSPDGEWLVFSGNNRLQKISVRGGSAIMLDDAMAPGTSAFWNNYGQIYYSDVFGNVDILSQIDANGGTPSPIELVQADDVIRTRWPWLLPDNKSMLVSSSLIPPVREGNINLLDLEDGSTRPLIQNAYNARYVPTGHIVFVRAAALWAVPFDLQNLAITGPEVSIVQSLHTSGSNGAATYSFSEDGLLVYLPGRDTTAIGNAGRTLHWVDKEGNQESLSLSRDFLGGRLSPDGQKLAVTIRDANFDVWVYDLVRNTLGRLTFDEARDSNPIWSIDGQQIIFQSTRGESGGWGIWSRAADGTGQPEPILTGIDGSAAPLTMTPDGSQLIYVFDSDIYMLTPGDDSEPRLLIQEPAFQTGAVVSPDGRYIAYQSNESGRTEIYVRPFPNVGDGRWQISTMGGAFARWNSAGDELFFTSPFYDDTGENSAAVWSVSLNTNNGFQFSEPEMLFTGNYLLPSPNTGVGWDVSPDGSRFLFMRDGDEVAASSESILGVVENWFEELNRLAPPDLQ